MAEDFTYDRWMNSQGIPVHSAATTSRTCATSSSDPWSLRECDAAFIQLEGMPGVVEGRVQEVPPGGSIKPFKQAIDEMVYVASGQGTASVWSGDGGEPHTFEWSPRSLFLVPRNSWAQFNNMQGDRPARLLHYNYLPIAMSAIPNPDFFFNNPFEENVLAPEATSTPRQRRRRRSTLPRARRGARSGSATSSRTWACGTS